MGSYLPPHPLSIVLYILTRARKKENFHFGTFAISEDLPQIDLSADLGPPPK